MCLYTFRQSWFRSSVQLLSLTLCDPMDWSMPGLPVHLQLPEITQTHVHWVSDAIQPSHPLSSPSPPAFNLSQHQGLFQRVSSLHQVAKVLEFQLQLQSFHWIFRTDLLYDWLVGSPCSPRDSQESSPGRSQDGRGVGQGKHFLPHKFIKRTFKYRVNSTKQLLKAGRGHKAPRKATQVFERR